MRQGVRVETKVVETFCFEIGDTVAYGYQEDPQVGTVRYFTDGGKKVFVFNLATRKYDEVEVSALRLIRTQEAA